MHKDLEKRLHQLQLPSNKAVNGLLAGEYRSCFRGRGIEFDDVRAYQAGDEVRSIDWNVTARTGEPYVKRFVEERERPMYLVLDVSASFHFGGEATVKRDAAVELATLLALSAVKNNDRVGLILFSDDVELYMPPAKGKSHVMAMISRLADFKPTGSGTDVTAAMEFLDRVARRRSVVFVFSDFQDEGYVDAVQRVAHVHDCTAVTISDRHETVLPDVGLVRLRDAETGACDVIDTSDLAVRDAHAGSEESYHADHRRALSGIGVDHLHVHTDDDYIEDLIAFFHSKQRFGAHGGS